MKKLSIVIALVLVLVLSLTSIALAAKPATFEMEYYQTQFQWRADKGQALSDWTYIARSSLSSSEFRLTGNVLHTAWSYSPLVDELKGESTVYVYDKKLDCWIEKEGTVSYKYLPGYGDYTIVNYWRGYLEFSGTPNRGNFEHGVAYQWAYLLAPQDMSSPLPYSVWCDTMGAWLVGFSIYLWDPGEESYDESFPDPFIAPVPASNYDPLDL